MTTPASTGTARRIPATSAVVVRASPATIWSHLRPGVVAEGPLELGEAERAVEVADGSGEPELLLALPEGGHRHEVELAPDPGDGVDRGVEVLNGRSPARDLLGVADEVAVARVHAG